MTYLLKGGLLERLQPLRKCVDTGMCSFAVVCMFSTEMRTGEKH